MDVKRYTPCNIGRTINRPIMLGKVGEINALRIEFDCEEWLTDYPDAAVELFVKRPDNDKYHPALGEDGYVRIWIIDERAVLAAGSGVIELVLQDSSSGTRIKSATGYTTVVSSPSAEGEASDLGFVTYSRAQNLTEAQKRQARSNIGAGTGTGTGTGSGTDGFSPTIKVEKIDGGNRLTITDIDGTKVVDVMDGKNGKNGEPGEDGRGIESVVRTSGDGSPGSTDVYTITYTDGYTSTLTVYNGKDGAAGEDGVSPTVAVETIDGGHRVTITSADSPKSFEVMDGKTGDPGEPGAPGEKGEAGRGILNIARTSGDGSAGTVDTYTIYYTDGTESTYQVRNGADGKDGSNAEGGGSSVELDNTLTQSGKAADAKATGDALNELNEANEHQDNRLKALEEVGGIVAVEPAQDDVPIVFFGSDLPQTKTDTVMPFKYVSKTKTVSGYVKAKAQGNSSMSYPKKNQTVNMYIDEALTESMKVDFKGWGAQKKHVYKANWIDLTHARNVVSAQLWGDVVKSRANYADLPELLRASPNQGAIDGFPAQVYANGVYQGRYTINIPKDGWMANMDKTLDTHCILCGENYVSGCFRAAANINGSDWSDEVHDTVPEAIKTRWNEIISFVMNSTDEEFVAGIGNYFYLDSLIDYYIFGVVSCGLDAFGKNQLYMTYDGQKWIASMYDMDSTWGLWWNGGSFVATTYARTEFQDFKDGQGNLLYIRLEELFYEQIQARWAELKDTVLSYANIMTRFERFIGIVPPHIVKEDYASTTGGGSFTGIPSQSTNHIQQIRSYVAARLPYADEWFASLTPAVEVPCTGITLDQTTLTFTAAGTQTLTATVTPDDTTDEIVWSSSDSSIASVNGGVVAAKANGSATITATCGEYSASCAVSVSGIEEETDIDYSLDALSHVTWSNGSYNEYGEFVSGSNYISSKFELQECAYDVNMPDGTSWPSLKMWDENGVYAGYAFDIASPIKTGKVEIIGRTGWQYAFGVSTTDEALLDEITMMPIDSRETKIDTAILDLKSLEWTVDAGSAVVLNCFDPKIVRGNVLKSNYNLILWNVFNANKGSADTDNDVLTFVIKNWSTTQFLVCTNFSTAEDAIAYFTEHNTQLILNA
ncbi:MAG: CotH kinase family protein [Clostridia bacterium]|nr:CotH kinase family protein [Clostridia bacterium]